MGYNIANAIEKSSNLTNYYTQSIFGIGVSRNTQQCASQPSSIWSKKFESLLLGQLGKREENFLANNQKLSGIST